MRTQKKNTENNESEVEAHTLIQGPKYRCVNSTNPLNDI